MFPLCALCYNDSVKRSSALINIKFKGKPARWLSLFIIIFIFSEDGCSCG